MKLSLSPLRNKEKNPIEQTQIIEHEYKNKFGLKNHQQFLNDRGYSQDLFKEEKKQEIEESEEYTISDLNPDNQLKYIDKSYKPQKDKNISDNLKLREKGAVFLNDWDYKKEKMDRLLNKDEDTIQMLFKKLEEYEKKIEDLQKRMMRNQNMNMRQQKTLLEQQSAIQKQQEKEKLDKKIIQEQKKEISELKNKLQQKEELYEQQNQFLQMYQQQLQQSESEVSLLKEINESQYQDREDVYLQQKVVRNQQQNVYKNYEIQDDESSNKVYVTETGKKYHKKGCQYLKSIGKEYKMNQIPHKYTKCLICFGYK